MRKESVIADLRAQGHKGGGFDALTAAAFKDEIRRRTVMAENATNGYMLGPAGKKAGIDPYSLFTGPQSRARKYASPELKEWFDQNGRPTVADLRASLLGQKAGMRPADFYASVTEDDVAAVELTTISGQLDLATAVTVAPEAMKPPGLPVPDDPAAISMFTAHRVDSVLHELSHGAERMEAARAASGNLRAYHCSNLARHLQDALNAARHLAENIRGHYPAEAAELDAVAGTVGLAKAVSDDARAATTAHLLETTLHELAHADRHARQMLEDTPDDEWDFNGEHCAKHLTGAIEHAGKLAAHFRDNYPAEGRWLARLEQTEQPAEGDGEPGHARYGKGGTVIAQMANTETISGQALLA
jgi:hypothetical protein